MMPINKAQALDSKTKAFIVMCTYGTVGGALLGFATMAFGTNSRAIAQGASLGLYAGIAFGSYVIFSHGKQSAPGGYYEDEYGPVDPYAPAPVDGGLPPQDSGGFGAPVPTQDNSSSGGGFFGQRMMEVDNSLHDFKLKNKKGRNNLPLYINFYNSTF